MFVLPTLPEAIAIPLDDAGLPGVVAHARPFDPDELADHFDTMGEGANRAAVRVVRKRLVRIENLAVQENGAAVPFEPKKELHLRMLPTRAHTAIYRALMQRAGLSEEQQKNSDSPSGSASTTDGST